MVTPSALRSASAATGTSPSGASHKGEADLRPAALAVAPGVFLWRGYFSKTAQQALLAEVFAGLQIVPLYRPVMPGTGKAFSVEESNFGPLGWVADKSGYRYQKTHPVTGAPWPAIPDALLDLWRDIAETELSPQCCLVNLYRERARMGLHQDKDEAALEAPVISVSLGDEAVFRIGTPERGGPTKSLRLQSGDVLRFGGAARLAYHGIDRILPGSSTLVSDILGSGGGRLNLTLRRITS